METTSNIYAICQCGYYDFQPLCKQLSSQHNATCYRNVLHVNWQQGELFVFDYGVLVFWNIPEKEREAIQNLITPFIQEPITAVLDDAFTYELNASQLTLKNDHVSLPEDDILTRLAISHGIAQSAKLSQYEAHVSDTINASQYIPENIATTGKSGLKRKELAKLRGQLYLTKSDVMLHYDLLDVPDFFWEHPEFESYYSMIADYLEIKPRIEVINKKLETIQDLLQMIADEQNHSHSSLLEWIIIWLIAIDIGLILIQEYIFKHP